MVFGVLTYQRSAAEQRQVAALGVLQEHLKLAVEHPDLASRDHDQPVDAKYGWFATHALFTAETLWGLVGNDPRWEKAIDAILRQHRGYLEQGVFPCGDYSREFVKLPAGASTGTQMRQLTPIGIGRGSVMPKLAATQAAYRSQTDSGRIGSAGNALSGSGKRGHMWANVPCSSMPQRRRVLNLRSAAIALLATACATMSPEQAARRELLSQAAQDCQRRHPFIQRFEFDRFDRLLWYYREGTGQADRDLFSTCYRERVAELTKTGAATAAASGSQSPASGTQRADLPVEAWKEPPVWKPGDEWTYRWESPRGGGTFVWRVRGEENINGTDCYVIDGGRYETYFRKSDLAAVQEKDRGALAWRNVPPLQWLVWPLQLRREWELLFVQERPQDRTTNNLLRAWRVATKERVTVPAGTFEAYKILERDKWSGNPVAERWLAPEVRGLVRASIYHSYGVEKRELTAFKLVEG